MDERGVGKLSTENTLPLYSLITNETKRSLRVIAGGRSGLSQSHARAHVHFKQAGRMEEEP